LLTILRSAGEAQPASNNLPDLWDEVLHFFVSVILMSTFEISECAPRLTHFQSHSPNGGDFLRRLASPESKSPNCP
jgi:hypothetical protein